MIEIRSTSGDLLLTIGADSLAGANLYGADLYEANLHWADLRGATMPDGESWEQYLAEVVPALLTAGGRPLAEVTTEEVWACHSWANCPMAAAFGVQSEAECPRLLRPRVREFLQLFDAGLIPRPTGICPAPLWIEEWEDEQEDGDGMRTAFHVIGQHGNADPEVWAVFDTHAEACDYVHQQIGRTLGRGVMAWVRAVDETEADYRFRKESERQAGP